VARWYGLGNGEHSKLADAGEREVRKRYWRDALATLKAELEWAGPENVDEQLARRTGRIYVADVEVPGAGRP
jgi:hypothetical protein